MVETGSGPVSVFLMQSYIKIKQAYFPLCVTLLQCIGTSVLNDSEITSLVSTLKAVSVGSRNAVIQYLAHEQIPSLPTAQGSTTAKTEQKPT